MSVHFRYALAVSLLVFTGFMAWGQKDSWGQQDIRCPCAADGICYPNRGQWGWQETQWRRWPSMPAQPGTEGPSQGQPRRALPPYLAPNAYDEMGLGPSSPRGGGPAVPQQIAPPTTNGSQRRPMPSTTEPDPLLPQPMPQPTTPTPPIGPKRDVDPFQDDPLQPTPTPPRGSLQPPVKPSVDPAPAPKLDPTPAPKEDGQARHSVGPAAPGVVIRQSEPAVNRLAAPPARTIPATSVPPSLESTIPQNAGPLSAAPQKSVVQQTPSPQPSVAQTPVRPATAIAPLDHAPSLESTVPQSVVRQESAKPATPVANQPATVSPNAPSPRPAQQANPFQYAGAQQQPVPTAASADVKPATTEQPAESSSQPGKPAWQRFGYPTASANQASPSAVAPVSHQAGPAGSQAGPAGSVASQAVYLPAASAGVSPASASPVSAAVAHEPIGKPRGAEASRVHLAGAFPDLPEQAPAAATASYTVSDDGTGMSLEDSIPGAAKPAGMLPAAAIPTAVKPAVATEPSLESTIPSRPMTSQPQAVKPIAVQPQAVPASAAQPTAQSSTQPSAAKINAVPASSPVVSPAVTINMKPAYGVVPATAVEPVSRGLSRLEDSTPRGTAGNPLR